MSVRTVKTQISFGIRPVWSEFSLCVQWVAMDPRFLRADSGDSDQTGRTPRLIWVFAGPTLILLVLSRLIYSLHYLFIVILQSDPGHGIKSTMKPFITYLDTNGILEFNVGIMLFSAVLTSKTVLSTSWNETSKARTSESILHTTTTMNQSILTDWVLLPLMLRFRGF